MTDEDRDFRFALGENDSEMASNLPVFYKDQFIGVSGAYFVKVTTEEKVSRDLDQYLNS